MYREVNKHARVCVCVCFQELDFAFEDHLEAPPGNLRGMKLIKTVQHCRVTLATLHAVCLCVTFVFLFVCYKYIDPCLTTLPSLLLCFVSLSLSKHIKIRLR